MHTWGDKGVHAFAKSINPKVNIIAQLEFKLTHFKAAVLHFSHYAKGTLRRSLVRRSCNCNPSSGKGLNIKNPQAIISTMRQQTNIFFLSSSLAKSTVK